VRLGEVKETSWIPGEGALFLAQSTPSIFNDGKVTSGFISGSDNFLSFFLFFLLEGLRMVRDAAFFKCRLS
jgi:hypothetical protein